MKSITKLAVAAITGAWSDPLVQVRGNTTTQLFYNKERGNLYAFIIITNFTN